MKRGNTMTIMQIPIQYKTTLQGEHNTNVYMCKHCDRDLVEGLPLFRESFIGFAELAGDLVIIYRCPGCFEVLYHHAQDIRVKMFLEYRARQQH